MGKIAQNKKAKEEALFRTAFELFTTKGIEKTTISDIVEKAGVAKGTFYLYFKDKSDIRDKLVTYETGRLFYRAHKALDQTEIQGFENKLFFIIDHILAELNNNHPLLEFTSKNLSWGIYRSAYVEHSYGDKERYQFYQAYLQLLEKSEKKYSCPDLMLFTIIEMVGATGYGCILYQEPVSLEEYMPYLHKAIQGILDRFSENA